MFYHEPYIIKYLDALLFEVKKNYKGEVLRTIYIGGGTPSVLSISELEKLFEVIKLFNLSDDCEFTFEANAENLDKEKLEFLFNNRVNRLSIGVQTFNPKFIDYLGRKHNKEMVFDIVNLAKEVGFYNINLDLMYGMKNQTLDDLIKDINLFLELEPTHISTYSLIIEKNTMLSVKGEEYIDDDLDFAMYNLIREKLSLFKHYEVSNFALNGFNSRHNLTYWNNEEYYGFGLSASGYLNNIRYTNTRNIKEYFNHNFISEENIISLEEKLSNEFILGFRKIDGINKKDFFTKYGYEVVSNSVVKKLLEEGKLVEDSVCLKIALEYIYLSNDILINFL